MTSKKKSDSVPATNATDFLKSLTSVIKNEYAAIASEGLYSDTFGYVDTGTYLLNAILSGSIYGGFPDNKILTLAGETATGKTYFLLAIIKYWLDQHPTGSVVLFESEGAITTKILVERGMDVSRLLIVPVSTVQEFEQGAFKILDVYENLKTRAPMLLALDSLGMLSTTKEMADTADGSEKKDMTRAGAIKKAFRTLTLKMSKIGVPLIVTNHVYANVGGGLYDPKHVVGGGSGLLYSSDEVLMLTKSKARDEDNQIVGVKLTATAMKSRIVQEGKRVEVVLNFQTGIDKWHGLLDLCLAYGIFEKTSTQIQVDANTKVFGKAIRENPEKYFTKEVLDRLDVEVQKHFKYGAGQTVGETLDLILKNS
jgi:RecA/RadA recombinase